MMPYCSYKRCRKVSSKKLGVINQPDLDGEHGAVVYVCEKHRTKLLKLLGLIK